MWSDALRFLHAQQWTVNILHTVGRMQLPNPKCISSYQHAHSVCPKTNMHHPLMLSWHAAEQALPPPPQPPNRLSTPSKMCQSGQPCSLLFTDLSGTMCDLAPDVILQGRCLLQHLPIWCCLLPFQPFTPVPFSSCRPCCGLAKLLYCCITPPWPGCSPVCYAR